jgi:glycosyltransferase involved in cell wall biosynthesis
VVVPARDEATTLPTLLDALLAQTRQAEEIVVADAGSRDGTPEVLERYRLRVRAVRVGPAMPGRARNAAVAESRHPWLALVDAGCRPERDWLERLVSPFASDPDLDVVFGDHLPLLETEWDRIQALCLMAPIDPGTGVHGPSVASMLLRRSLFEKVGGFREDLRAAEDHVFFAALRAVGARVAWAPRAAVRWQLSSSPWASFRRLVSYSEHHLRAGLARTWHRRVMTMHLFAGALLFLAPSAGTILVLAGLLATRAFLTAWHRRGNLDVSRPLMPSRLLGVALLLVLADAAVWMGAARLLLRRASS